MGNYDDLLPTVEPFPTLSLKELRCKIAEAPAPRFLVRRLIVTDDYGFLAAERKWGKSYFTADLAVNVAGGGKVLGAYQVDTPGPVLVFAGEGGWRKIDRRLQAVTRFYGFDHDSLPVHIHERAPKLVNFDQLARLEETVKAIKPVLTLIDPAYLALAGAQTSQLVEMGELLERAQHAVVGNGSALMFTHHWNKTGQGSGIDRSSGSGFGEWARFMVSGSTTSASTDMATGCTNHLVQLDVTGDEIPGEMVTFRRKVWVDDRDDLTSRMHYSVEITEKPPVPEVPETSGMKPAAKRVFKVLSDSGDWLDKHTIGDRVAAAGMPLKPRTIQEATQHLRDAGLIDVDERWGNIAQRFRIRDAEVL